MIDFDLHANRINLFDANLIFPNDLFENNGYPDGAEYHSYNRYTYFDHLFVLNILHSVLNLHKADDENIGALKKQGQSQE